MIFDDVGLFKTINGTLSIIDYTNGILNLNSSSMSDSKAIIHTLTAQLQCTPQGAEIAVMPELCSQSYVGSANSVP